MTEHAHCVPREDYNALMAHFNGLRQANVNLAAEVKALQGPRRWACEDRGHRWEGVPVCLECSAVFEP